MMRLEMSATHAVNTHAAARDAARNIEAVA